MPCLLLMWGETHLTYPHLILPICGWLAIGKDKASLASDLSRLAGMFWKMYDFGWVIHDLDELNAKLSQIVFLSNCEFIVCLEWIELYTREFSHFSSSWITLWMLGMSVLHQWSLLHVDLKFGPWTKWVTMIFWNVTWSLSDFLWADWIYLKTSSFQTGPN